MHFDFIIMYIHITLKKKVKCLNLKIWETGSFFVGNFFLRAKSENILIVSHFSVSLLSGLLRLLKMEIDKERGPYT